MLRMKFGNVHDGKMLSKMQYIDTISPEIKPYDKEKDVLFEMSKQQKAKNTKYITLSKRKISKVVTVTTNRDNLASAEAANPVRSPKIHIKNMHSALITSQKPGESPILGGSISHRITGKNAEGDNFKSLYVQNLVKGSTSLKGFTSRRNNFTMVPEQPKITRETQSHDNHLQSNGFCFYTQESEINPPTRRIDFTSPSYLSFAQTIQDLNQIPSLENKQAESLKFARKEARDERLNSRSPVTDSMSPTYQVHIMGIAKFEASPNFDARKSLNSIGGALGKEATPKSKGSSHVREVKEWRSKIFKKPSSKTLKNSTVKKVEEVFRKTALKH